MFKTGAVPERGILITFTDGRDAQRDSQPDSTKSKVTFERDLPGSPWSQYL